MSTNAVFAHEPVSHQPRGQHARSDKREVAIRVLACPGAEAPCPHHARAIPVPQESIARPGKHVGWPQSLSGIAYNLSKSERRFALAAGVVFAATSLAVILL